MIMMAGKAAVNDERNWRPRKESARHCCPSTPAAARSFLLHCDEMRLALQLQGVKVRATRVAEGKSIHLWRWIARLHNSLGGQRGRNFEWPVQKKNAGITEPKFKDLVVNNHCCVSSAPPRSQWQPSISVGGKARPWKDKFKSLGGQVTATGELHSELNHRNGLAAAISRGLQRPFVCQWGTEHAY